MTIDLIGIPLHFIENVHLVGATHKHLRLAVSDECKEVNLWHTIMALTRVSPTLTKEPAF